MAFEKPDGDDAGLRACDFDTLTGAVAHPLRLQILTWLKTPELYLPDQQYGHESGVCAGQITGRCGPSKSTVSVHLNRLRTAGLVDLNRVATVHFYQRNEKAILRLCSQFRVLLKGEL
jgi:DNA-binding transcriptional ArsR family regulator